MIYPGFGYDMKGGCMKGGGMKGKGKGKGTWAYGGSPHKGGKGGGPNKSGNRKRKAKNDGPVQPLDNSVLEQITEFVTENGGSAPLGRITTVFEGVKKVQIEDHFNVEEVGDGDFMVSSLDSPPLATRIRADPKVGARGNDEPRGPKPKKVKAPKDPDAPPPTDLDTDVLNKITGHLEACGGSLPLGKLATKFPGLKKVQLEGHFEVQHGEKDSIVRVFGADNFAMAKANKKANIEDMENRPTKKRKREKAPKDPNAPPPPALDDTKLEKITDWLNDVGGSAALGKLTTAFPGVKKAQLEGNFVLTPGERRDTADPIVSFT